MIFNTKIKEIDLSNFDPSKVTSIDNKHRTINYFGTSNISFYKLLEDRKINISQEIIKNETNDGKCNNGIYYSTFSE